VTQKIAYDLLPGTSSALITPPADTPVFVIANNTTSGDRGTSFISLERLAGTFLEWTGDSSPNTANGGGAVTSGFTGVAGTSMVKVSFDGLVTLEVAGADSFVIHNASGLEQTGEIFMYSPS
jgi:hypothetical protein